MPLRLGSRLAKRKLDDETVEEVRAAPSSLPEVPSRKRQATSSNSVDRVPEAGTSSIPSTSVLPGSRQGAIRLVSESTTPPTVGFRSSDPDFLIRRLREDVRIMQEDLTFANEAARLAGMTAKVREEQLHRLRLLYDQDRLGFDERIAVLEHQVAELEQEIVGLKAGKQGRRGM